MLLRVGIGVSGLRGARNSRDWPDAVDSSLNGSPSPSASAMFEYWKACWECHQGSFECIFHLFVILIAHPHQFQRRSRAGNAKAASRRSTAVLSTRFVITELRD